MVRYSFIFVVVILLIANYEGKSQNLEVNPDYSSDSVLYKETLSGGVIFHNRGLGLEGRRGKNLKSFRNRFFEANLVYIKSDKQIRSINPYYPTSRSFIYGKLNEFFTLRGGMGYNIQLNRKPYWGGVEVRYNYSGGLSLGLSKPVYYYVDNTGTGFYDTQKFEPDLNVYDIVSKAPFVKGLNEIKVHPGFYLKGGINFEFGAYKSRLNRLEIGSVLDVYLINVEMMALNDPQNFFLSFYIAYHFGKRYNVY